ncbi:MAG: sulfatase [Cellvibrionaceae bacterium]
MKKFILFFLVFVLVAGVLGWNKKNELLVAAIKYKAHNQYPVAPNREIPWPKGPEDIDVHDQRPNIILIVADDLGNNDISTFGGGVSGDGGAMQTPNIDRLAREGAVFSQSYSGASTCAPSRAMMMTGRYPTRTGYQFTPTPDGMAKVISALSTSDENNMPPALYDQAKEASQPPYELKGLPAEEVTIAEMLKQQGYYTAHIGKWHLGRGNGMAPHEQGFDDSLLMASGLYLPEDDPNVVNAKLPFDPIDKFLWAGMTYAASFNSGDNERFLPKGYLTDYWTDESVKVIKNNKHRPFFLYLAHWGPHTPLQATREDYDAVEDITPHRKRVYAGMIRAVDRSVGRILDTLESEGIAENTIVMFTSDNGGAGYIGVDDVNEPYRGWKITSFEGGIRVPMFVKWPAKIAAGSEVDIPVAHIDVMPTLAAASGTPNPEDVIIDGVDILPLLSESGIENWNRESIFWQNGHYQVVRHGDWKLQVNNRPTDGVNYWLYDLENDPTEQTNLANIRVDKLDELKELLAEHQVSSRPPLFDSIIQAPILVDKTRAEKYVEGDEYVYTPN